MEIKKEGYAYPISPVAEEFWANMFNPDMVRYEAYPWLNKGLKILHKSLQSKVKGFLDEVSFSQNVVDELSQNLKKEHPGPGYTREIPLTVAAAILLDDPALKVPDLHPVFQRYLLDSSIGVFVLDHLASAEKYRMEFAYDPKNSSNPIYSGEIVWETIAKKYQSLQLKLRATSVASMSQVEL